MKIRLEGENSPEGEADFSCGRRLDRLEIFVFHDAGLYPGIHGELVAHHGPVGRWAVVFPSPVLFIHAVRVILCSAVLLKLPAIPAKS